MGRRRVSLAVLLALLSAVAASALVAAPAPANAASVVDVEVHPLLTTGARYSSARDIACATSTLCLIASTPSAKTSDAGATWTPVELGPYEVGGLTSVDCWSGLGCLGFANPFGYRTDDGGQHWTALPPTGDKSLDDVACPTATHCVAEGRKLGVDADGIWTTDDLGQTWVQRYLTDNAYDLDHVACASVSFCVASGFGTLVASTDAGGTWTPFGSPLGAVTIACAAPSTCVVVTNGRMISSTDGGASWETVAEGSYLVTPNAIDCTSASLCAAVGYDPWNAIATAVTFDPAVGDTTAASLPDGLLTIDLVDCHGTTCMAVGDPSVNQQAATTLASSALLRSTDGGVSWSQVSSPAPVEQLRSVACVDSDDCVAVGDIERLDPVQYFEASVERSTDGGHTWHAAGSPASLGALVDVSCVPAGACVAVGSDVMDGTRDAMAVSDDGGLTWSPSATPVPLSGIRDLTCHAGGVCYAVSNDATAGSGNDAVILRSVDSGATFVVVASFPMASGHIVCADGESCLATMRPNVVVAEWSMWGSVDGGDSWQDVTIDDGAADLELAGCAGTRCLVILEHSDRTQTTYSTTDTGTTWSAEPGVQPLAPGVFGCAASRCIFSRGDYQTTLYTSPDDGHTWQVVGAAEYRRFDPIVCKWESRCIAVGARTSYGTAIVELALSVRDVPDPPPTTTVPVLPKPSEPVPPSLVGISPARLLETRTGPQMQTVDGLYQGGGRVHAGTELVLPVRGRGGVVSGAGSVALNLTVTEPAAPGYVTVYPCDVTRPLASNVNFTSGQTVANAVIAKVAANGTVCLFSSVDTHLVVDADGYVSSSDPSLIGVVPARLMDSRSGLQSRTSDHLFEGGGRIAAGSTAVLAVGGRGGVPADARGAVLNITVTEPAAAGFVTVYPCNDARPLASTVNFTPWTTVANAAFSRLPVNGQVCLYSSADTHLVVDVNGYVRSSTLDITGVVPVRLLETRVGPRLWTVDHIAEATGEVGAGSVTTLRLRGRSTVGVNAESVLINVTVTEPKSPGFVTVYPCDQPRPTASNVNFTAGATVANFVLAKVSASGDLCLFSSAATQLVVDVSGYTVTLPPHF